MFFADVARSGQQQPGSIRGIVSDKDFGTPLAGAQVTMVETSQKATTTDLGHFVFAQVPPGKYTLIFSKDGYVRQVKNDVLVSAGQLTNVDIPLPGEFTEMDEFVVQDIMQSGTATEAALLKLRFESPSLMDSISSELMNRAGAGDAAAALRLVPGASLQNSKSGKSAVIRGLPDRYVSSQLNGVRLPTADEDKRAVELDQFPAPMIDSIQVSKTFTPDQQGDASGGAVNLKLKGIPDEPLFQIKSQITGNSQVTGRSNFLSYDGGGVNFWGRDDGSRDQQLGSVGKSWNGAVGTSTTDAPIDYKWSAATGGKIDVDNGVKIGGFASFFYERNSSFFDNGQDNSYWVEHPGAPMTPQTFQGTPSSGGGGDFKTGLYDITQGTQGVRWGGLGSLGVETENNKVNLNYLYTRSTADTATLATDTRGKEYFFPGYNPNDPTGTGNDPNNLRAAPYLRLETLSYTERTTNTTQLAGWHRLPIEGFNLDDILNFHKPEFDWSGSYSSSELDQPDKRQFGALWLPPSFNPGSPPFVPPFTTPGTWLPYKPAANFTLGNAQRIWKDIQESSDQYALNLKFPFEQWGSQEGYLKFGYFDDDVHRKFNQDTFSNFNDNSSFQGNWDDPWSGHFPFEDHPISPSFNDVDYKGRLQVSAEYAMMDLPLASFLRVIGGARLESTHISIVNDPEKDATWFPPGSTEGVKLNPGDADVSFNQDDLLPAVELVVTPIKQVTVRGAYSETVARQTFKELTPIIQQEFLGGPIFIGNPDLGMSALKNYDLRVDFTPIEEGLLSASYFYKSIRDPIEYEQRFVGFDYTTAVNYPKGWLSGYELEARQSLGRMWDPLEGLAVGANATYINSEVTLPAEEAATFEQPNIQVPMSTRDMTNAPDHLYNLYCTYDFPVTGTSVGIFYIVQGDTLIAGATQSNGNFIPNVYAKQYDTLNLSLSQKLGQYFRLQLQIKNLTNPDIQTVYRSSAIGSDVTKTSYSLGIEYSLSLSAEFSF